MAHRSKQKHIKHVHEHEPARPKAKSPIAKAEAAAAGIAKKRSVRRAPEPVDTGKRKPKGLVRRLARRARKVTAKMTKRVTAKVTKRTKKIAAKPREMIQRAKDRVKAMLGAEES